ncbi:hypothetical protein HII31_04446 [Pseudocercospora fuligena]|uniref:Uncharacterized protein n=1 Tax=Pseudocercospora fuligena TaxID=685502 RepID=A0A8H6RND3_9PEZI|nr:hypothetical protein HII31_04446 [Pseudocercospora fuligena]
MSIKMWSTTALIIALATHSIAQNCYYGPGAAYRADTPADLVPCNTTAEQSACCRLGDVCLTGNACYNWATGNTYMYGCTDINYEDETCPKKCNVDPADTPWIGLDYCGTESNDFANTWTCLSPDSCGCEWNGSYALQILPKRSCRAMGSEAKVALYAPSTLLPYVSLPTTVGGSTGYYSTTTDSAGSWMVITTVIPNYTPTPWTQFTTYDRNVPDTAVVILDGVTPSPSTNSPAYVYTDSTPPATAPVDSPTNSPSSTAGSTLTAPPTSGDTSGSPSQSVASTSTSSPSPTAAASGLSTGAKAGIGAGVAGGVCLAAAIGICWFLYARRRRRNNTNKVETQQSPPQYPQMPQMAPYQQAPPGGVTWVPVPSGTVPFYMQPMANKDDPAVSMHHAPAYSPPRSPPPMSELSSDAVRTAVSEADATESHSVHSGASPRLSATHFERSGSPRYA